MKKRLLTQITIKCSSMPVVSFKTPLLRAFIYSPSGGGVFSFWSEIGYICHIF